MKKFLCKLGGGIAMSWWCFWSNIRFRKAQRTPIRNYVDENGNKKAEEIIDKEDLICFGDEEIDAKKSQEPKIQNLINRLYYRFNWTADGIDQLWDAITPPPQAYLYNKTGSQKDDCDGFHSCVYFTLFCSGFENVYLLSANAVGSGHCILLYKDLDLKWKVIDYYHIYGAYDTPEEAVENYNLIYQERYHAKKVFFNGLVRYDFYKGKFHPEHFKNLV